jgi:hypothetical protein
VNFGSFTFLYAVACRGWKNVKVPKFEAGCVGKFGLYMRCPSIFAPLRVSDNVLQIGDGRAFQHKS